MGEMSDKISQLLSSLDPHYTASHAAVKCAKGNLHLLLPSCPEEEPPRSVAVQVQKTARKGRNPHIRTEVGLNAAIVTL